MSDYVIEILDGDRAGEVLALSGKALRIGRKQGNDLVLPDEKASGSHAEVAPDGANWVLRDLGSTNGTTLGGHKVTELVLGEGDVFTIGRTRLCFRSAGAKAPAMAAAAAVPGSAEDLSLHTIDQARLRKAGGGRSPLLLVGVAVAAAAAGAWFWLGGAAGTEPGTAGPRSRRVPPLEVAGNRVPQAQAPCETAEGWELRAAGAGFAESGTAHSGTGALEAARSEGVAESFAMARLAQPLTVVPGQVLTVAAHVRTEGGAKAAVRLHFSSSRDGVPFRFVTGTALAESAEYARASAAATVPPECDRATVELLATLPANGAIAWFDDVAVTPEGTATGVDLQLESGQSLVGTGSAVALRSTDAESPVMLAGILPLVGDGPLGALRDAGLLACSDVGAALQLEKTEESFKVAVTGAQGMVLQFPAELADGLLVRSEGDAFGAATGETVVARQLLLGGRRTRCLIGFEAPVESRVRTANGVFSLSVPATATELRVRFRAERSRATELLGAARKEAAAEPGAALDRLRDLVRTVPHDVEELTAAQELRQQLLEQVNVRLETLRKDLGESEFFETRGGFARVLEELDAIATAYGERNLADAASLGELRQRAAGKLQAIDGARASERRARLVELAEGLQSSGQDALAKVVKDYADRLPAAPAEKEE